MSTAIAAYGDHRTLSGPEKVAALLLAMGKPLASRLLKHFDPAELKTITRSAAALGAVPITALEDLVEELAQQFSRGVDLRGTAAEVEHLLGGVLPPEQVAEIMSDVLGSSNSSTWVRLSGLPEADLAAYVGKEHPQTAALILARLTPEAAAKTLAILPRESRNALTRRMLALRPVSDATIKILENKLRDDLLNGPPRDAAGNTRGRVADILNRMEPEQAEEVLSSIAEVKPVDAAALRSKMFSFNDVVGLPPKAKSVLFDRVPTEQITMALRGTDAT
ncbi:MAG: flagellar motor switch protein FliG, partial [Caulobacteraceae bacterium]|nr:flagellar motor switch protein FliG [Caulobacter sp.]